MLKLIFTIGVVYAVWYSFKNWARISAAYKEVQDEKARAEGAEIKSKPRQPVVQDLVPCPKCGSYVAAGAVCSCEKA